MRKYVLFVLLTGLLVTLSAQQRGRGKVFGLAREALSEQERIPITSKARGVAMHQDRHLNAFVRIDPSQVDEVLSRHGCRKLAQAGDICIVSIPFSVLPKLVSDSAVKRIEAAGTCQLTMDTTRTIVNAMPVYESTDLHQAYTGDGVVVGLMDVGFDLSHPTFYDSSGGTFRVGAFWDQLSADTVGSPFPVGRDYVGYEAVKAYGHSVDAEIHWHGNHTAGIAAGSGFDTPFRGMAFDSELCLVSNAVTEDTIYIKSEDYYKYTSATDALGFKYLFDYADRQGKPCVVSFSEGYVPYFDEEDSLYSAFLDSLTSVPGHILIASAGNQGFRKTYFEKPAEMKQAGSFIIPSEKKAHYRLKASGPLDIRLYIYNKQTSTLDSTHVISSADRRLDSLLVDTLFLGTDTCIVSVDRYASAMTVPTDTFYSLYLEATQYLTSVCTIALAVEGLGTSVEVYGSTSNYFADNSIDSRWNAAVMGHGVLAPGCFPSTICVGATSHRSFYITGQGSQKRIVTYPENGLLADYSSTGPSIIGLMKPDVVAPGSNLFSAYSRYYLDCHPERDGEIIAFSDFEGQSHPWAPNLGTSMSTPVVAGAIALWLQANPKLTQQEVMGVLSRSCSHPETSITYPNNNYGYGEIDVYRGLLDVLQLDKIKDISLHHPAGLYISPDGEGLRIKFDEEPTGPFKLKVFGLGGTIIFTTTLQPSSCEVIVNVPLQHGVVYVVQTESTDGKVCGSQLVRF